MCKLNFVPLYHMLVLGALIHFKTQNLLHLNFVPLYHVLSLGVSWIISYFINKYNITYGNFFLKSALILALEAKLIYNWFLQSTPRKTRNKQTAARNQKRTRQHVSDVIHVDISNAAAAGPSRAWSIKSKSGGKGAKKGKEKQTKAKEGPSSAVKTTSWASRTKGQKSAADTTTARTGSNWRDRPRRGCKAASSLLRSGSHWRAGIDKFWILFNLLYIFLRTADYLFNGSRQCLFLVSFVHLFIVFIFGFIFWLYLW
jgi:hypothetical protein